VVPPAEERLLLNGRDEHCGSSAAAQQPLLLWHNGLDASGINPPGEENTYASLPLLRSTSSVRLGPTIFSNAVRSSILD